MKKRRNMAIFVPTIMKVYEYDVFRYEVQINVSIANGTTHGDNSCNG